MKINFNINKRTITEYFFIGLGSIIMCLAIAMLVDIFVVPGGASGLSIAFYYVFDGTMPVGALKWIINIPLFIWGLLVLGKQFGFRTFYGFTMSSIFIDFFRGSIPGLEFIRVQDTEFVRNLAQNDFLFLILIAAVLMGFGLGIIFKFKGTTGGSDIPAAIFQKKYGMPPGQGIILVDFFIISLTGLIFYLKGIPLDKPIVVLILYSLFQLFASSYVIDIIIDGFDYARMALIVTDKSEEIAEAITKELSRGATAIKARGIYRNIDREIIMTVVTIKEVAILNDIVKSIDPDAFMISNTVHEVTGYGFRRRL